MVARNDNAKAPDARAIVRWIAEQALVEDDGVALLDGFCNALRARGLPLRRGYGQTGGPWLENFGRCSSPDYYRAGLTTAQDIRTVIDYFRGRTEVQRDRILLVGWSAGGWGSLAAASA